MTSRNLSSAHTFTSPPHDLPYVLTCLNPACGYQWTRRAPYLPIACPNCYSRHWHDAGHWQGTA